MQMAMAMLDLRGKFLNISMLLQLRCIINHSLAFKVLQGNMLNIYLVMCAFHLVIQILFIELI